MTIRKATTHKRRITQLPSTGGGHPLALFCIGASGFSSMPTQPLGTNMLPELEARSYDMLSRTGPLRVGWVEGAPRGRRDRQLL